MNREVADAVVARTLCPDAISAVIVNHRHLQNVVATAVDPDPIVLVVEGDKVGQVRLLRTIEQDAGVGIGPHREIIGQRAGCVDLDTHAERLNGRAVAFDEDLRRGFHHVNSNRTGRAEKTEAVEIERDVRRRDDQAIARRR